VTESPNRPFELPHVRLGRGDPLVVLTGLELENKAPAGAALKFLRWGYRSYARHHTVYHVTRRPHLPRSSTTRDMAADHALWMEREVGPAHVLGLSTGGEVAQYLAVDRPDLVTRLVISDSGCRLGEAAKVLLQSVRAKAAAGRAAEAHLDLSAHMDLGPGGRTLLRVFGSRLVRQPPDASDYISTIDADLAHDSCDDLARISAPTLVIGGTADFFYPESILEETANRIPRATLRLYDGIGHAVAKVKPRAHQRDVLAFLHDGPP
jgi:pimeloyl-ACP methyl ester carboxylesterase